jgi:hypothetical protein
MDFGCFFGQEYLKITDIKCIGSRGARIIPTSEKKENRFCQSAVIAIYHIITVGYGLFPRAVFQIST